MDEMILVPLDREELGSITGLVMWAANRLNIDDPKGLAMLRKAMDHPPAGEAADPMPKAHFDSARAVNVC